MAYLLALYWALIPAIGKNWACLAFTAPLFDTNFQLTAPMDTGPSLSQYIFISLALGSLFRYLSGARLTHYWLTWFFCGCRDWNPDWIQWLNREPQISEFNRRLEREGANIRVVRRGDSRQTEFILITRNPR